MKKKAKLFWLSDIHYCHENADIKSKSTYGARKDMIEAYFEKIAQKISDEKPTHIIITGDLAFSGEYDQYVGMYNAILKPYLDLNGNARLIICCGNHDCNRAVIHESKFTDDFLPHITKIDDYDGRKDVKEMLEKVKFDDIEKYKEIIKLSPKEGKRIKRNLDKSDKDSENFNMFNILFSGYQFFYKNYVQKRYNKINSSQVNIKLHFLNDEDNQGLWGVIHDVEYNLIFTILNSSWLAWGNETYKGLLAKVNFNTAFFEYGNLYYDDSTLKQITSVLTNFEESNILSENLVVCLSHHNFSWMSYKSQYYNMHFSDLLSLQDIMLMGHIHVKHYNPTIYRGKTICYEAPQVFDYHIYYAATKDFRKLEESLGFSVFEILQDLSQFTKFSYWLDNGSGSDTIFISRKPEFEWVQTKSVSQEPIKLDKKFKVNVVDISMSYNISSYCCFWAKTVRKVEEYHLPIDDKVYVDTVSLVKEFHYNKNLKYTKSLNDMEFNKAFLLFYEPNVKDTFVVYPKFDFIKEPKKLVEFLHYLIKEINIIKNIHVLFFDFQLLTYICGTNLSSFSEYTAIAQKYFDKVRVATIEDFSQSDNIDTSSISLSGEIIELIRYKEYLIKN